MLKLASDPEIRPGVHMYGGAKAAPDVASKALATELKACNRLFQFVFTQGVALNVPVQIVMGKLPSHLCGFLRGVDHRKPMLFCLISPERDRNRDRGRR